MFANDPGPAPVSSPPPEESGWEVRSGLTFREGEQLLDWLEANGVAEREAQVTPEGVVVRWRP